MTSWKRLITALTLAGLAAPASASLFRDWEDFEISEVKNKVTTAVNKADDIQDNMRTGILKLTGRARTAIDDVVSDLDRQINEHVNLAERSTFLGAGGGCGSGSDCGAFRSDLLDLVRATEDLANAALDFTPSNVRMDFGRLRNTLQSMPGKVLYPLHVAMSVNANVARGDTAATMDDAAARLGLVREALSDFTCDFALEHELGLVVAAEVLHDAGMLLQILGKFLAGSGEVEIEGNGAVWGWVGISVRANYLKMVGTWLEDLGIALSGPADRIQGKLADCAAARDFETLRALLFDGTAGVLDYLGTFDGTNGVLDVLSTMDAEQRALFDLLIDGQARILDNQARILANQQGLRDQADAHQERLLQGQEAILEAISQVGPPWGQAKGHR